MTLILVTGATGSIGRHVIDELGGNELLSPADQPTSSPPPDVRILVRDPARVRIPAGVGGTGAGRVDVVRGDLTDRESWIRALDGVDRVFLLWPFLSADGIAEVIGPMADSAAHVTYVSAHAVRDDRDPAANGVWGEVEHAIRQSGMDWTFLRVVGLATNTLGWADQIRSTGVVRWPYGRAKRSLIHERDVAAVAARTLTEAGHAGARYVLSGPEVLTQAEQVSLIGEAIGRPVRWEDVPDDQARDFLLAAWGDPGFVDSALRHWGSLVDEPEPVTPTVELVTGRPARSFRTWAEDHRADFE
jgi:uncharacterized protein YbjT (DUF2867 family)